MKGIHCVSVLELSVSRCTVASVSNRRTMKLHVFSQISQYTLHARWGQDHCRGTTRHIVWPLLLIKVPMLRNTKLCRMANFLQCYLLLPTVTLLPIVIYCYTVIYCYIWLPTVTYGYLLLQMVTNCHLWLPIVTNGYQLSHVVTYCYTCLPTVTYGYLLLPAVTYCYTWLKLSLMVTYCYKWLPTVTCGYLLLHMVTNCHMWLPIVTNGYQLSHVVTYCYTCYQLSHVVTYCYTWLPTVTYGYLLLPTYRRHGVVSQNDWISINAFSRNSRAIFVYLTKRETLQRNYIQDLKMFFIFPQNFRWKHPLRQMHGHYFIWQLLAAIPFRLVYGISVAQ